MDEPRTRELQEVFLKASFYDALTADPGPQDIDTLDEWHRLVKAIEYGCGSLVQRCQRINSHIAAKQQVSA